MNPKVDYRSIELEEKLKHIIECVDKLDNAISRAYTTGDLDIINFAKKLKSTYLSTINSEDIHEYLGYSRPLLLDVDKLIKIETYIYEMMADIVNQE